MPFKVVRDVRQTLIRSVKDDCSVSLSIKTTKFTFNNSNGSHDERARESVAGRKPNRRNKVQEDDLQQIFKPLQIIQDGSLIKKKMDRTIQARTYLT